MALLVEANLSFNYLEFLMSYQLKVQKGMEKNPLGVLKSLGEDFQEMIVSWMIDTAFSLDCNDGNKTNCVQ